MDKTQADITSSAEAIEAAFGGRWRVWLSDTGWWWAARCEPLNAAGLGAGCVPFLRAQTPAGLIDCIRDQEDLHMRAGRSQQAGNGSPPWQTRTHDGHQTGLHKQKETTSVNSSYAAQPHSAADAAPCQFTPDTAHPARVYNAWLGGKDHFDADRRAAGEVARHRPQVIAGARANRAFVARIVRYLTAERGIGQFLDIGPGLPAPGNTHEVAQAIDPSSRVVYADRDPAVLAHARGLLASDPRGACAYAEADLRDPAVILHEARHTLDFTRPAAVLLAAVLHFIPDAEDPAGIVEELADALAPGSFIAISHLTADFAPEQVTSGVAAYNSLVPTEITARTHAQITALFDRLSLVPPGVVPVSEWRPVMGYRPQATDIYAGLVMTGRRGRMP